MATENKLGQFIARNTLLTEIILKFIIIVNLARKINQMRYKMHDERGMVGLEFKRSKSNETAVDLFVAWTRALRSVVHLCRLNNETFIAGRNLIS